MTPQETRLEALRAQALARNGAVVALSNDHRALHEQRRRIESRMEERFRHYGRNYEKMDDFIQASADLKRIKDTQAAVSAELARAQARWEPLGCLVQACETYLKNQARR